MSSDGFVPVDSALEMIFSEVQVQDARAPAHMRTTSCERTKIRRRPVRPPPHVNGCPVIGGGVQFAPPYHGGEAEAADVTWHRPSDWKLVNSRARALVIRPNASQQAFVRVLRRPALRLLCRPTAEPQPSTAASASARYRRDAARMCASYGANAKMSRACWFDHNHVRQNKHCKGVRKP